MSRADRVRVCLLALVLIARAADASAQAAGVVLDGATGDPVAGAEIVVARDSVVAVTDGTGRWRIDAASTMSVLRVRHIGYATAIIPPTGGTAAIVTRLQRRPVDLGAIVVTAGRRLQRLADAVVATEVVSARDISETGASDVAAVLTERTGIQLTGGHPNGAGLMLQGLGAERLLVLIDGQPFIGRVAGEVDLSRLSTQLVERIEVVKGPQSTLYGSEAMGGVVNVITRDPGDAPWSASLRGVVGGEGRREWTGTATAAEELWSGLIQLGRRDIALTPGRSEESGAAAGRWDSAFRARWAGDSARTAELSAFMVDERQRWRTGQLYQFADNVHWGARASAGAAFGAHRFSPTLFATSFNHLSRSAARPAPAEDSGEEEQQRLLQGTLLYSGHLAALDVDAGMELRAESIRSERVRGGEMDMSSIGSHAQASLPLGIVTLVPGVRVTTSRAWGTHVTPRFATLIRPSPGLAVRASIGAGYRAPDFKELAMQFLNVGPGFGYIVRGNPALTPETSLNLTADLEWSGDHVYVRAQGFANRLDDFIETQLAGDSAGNQLFTYGNIASGKTRGVELEAATTWRGLRVESGYAWLYAVGADGAPLLGRPTHSGRLSFSYVQGSGLRVSVTSLYTGATPVAREETGVLTRDDFTRFDVRVAQSLPRGFELVVGADNVFDAQPARWPGLAGRHLYASIAWTARAH